MNFKRLADLMIFGSTMIVLAIVISAATGHQNAGFSEEQRVWLDKSMFYAFFNGLGVLCIACAGLITRQSLVLLKIIGFCVITGTLFFSGSLLALTFIESFSLRWLTPLGGALMILGWILFVVWCWLIRRKVDSLFIAEKASE